MDLMYRMKNIINHEEIILPKCMYNVKKSTVFIEDEININISNQVIKFLKGKNNKMTQLEERQDQLLKKLDVLYNRIKTISSFCEISNPAVKVRKLESSLPEPDEVVVVVSPESLPWFLIIILKEKSQDVNVSWHIHSSVPNEKLPKIKNFLTNLQCFKNNLSKINLRLIFKNVSADTELKLSSLALPIIGNVNILRYLSFVYPSAIYYDANNHCVDNSLDICHLLERTPEKNKDAVANKLFSQYKVWIHGNEFSIVDLAAYNVIKQWKNIPKCIPKAWFDSCEKRCLS